MRVQWVGDELATACFLPMPYAAHVRIVVYNTGNESASLRASVAADHSLPAEPWGYLHARAHTAVGPQAPGSQFEVINVAGRGRYVGTFLYAAGWADRRPGQIPHQLNILEGNELGVIDGEPRIHGTGTEDYCNGAFYFHDGPFDSPFAAANVVDEGGPGAPGVVSCCRWHLLSDAIDFQRSFALRFQYGANNPALVERYTATAYYYLDRPTPESVDGGNWPPKYAARDIQPRDR